MDLAVMNFQATGWRGIHGAPALFVKEPPARAERCSDRLCIRVRSSCERRPKGLAASCRRHQRDRLVGALPGCAVPMFDRLSVCQPSGRQRGRPASFLSSGLAIVERRLNQSPLLVRAAALRRRTQAVIVDPARSHDRPTGHEQDQPNPSAINRIPAPSPRSERSSRGSSRRTRSSGTGCMRRRRRRAGGTRRCFGR